MTHKQKLAIYPGSFDPITYGHLEILKRATHMFDEIVVAPAKIPSKSTIFNISQRIQLIKDAIKSESFSCPIRIEPFDGLLVDFAKTKKAHALIRGLRAVSDFEYEFQMALMNRKQSDKIETVFLMPDEKFVYLSSSMVKEIARLKGDLKAFVPSSVLKALQSKFGRKSIKNVVS